MNFLCSTAVNACAVGRTDLISGASDTSVDRLGQTESIRSDIFDSSVTKEFL
jgi:hypothetical protein